MVVLLIASIFHLYLMLGPCAKHPSARADGPPRRSSLTDKSIALTNLKGQVVNCSLCCHDWGSGSGSDSGWRRNTRVLLMSASGSLTREVDGAGDVEGSGTWMETEELVVSTISPRRRSLTSVGGALLDRRIPGLSMLGVTTLAGTTSTKVFRTYP